jgi:hypothetical protein
MLDPFKECPYLLLGLPTFACKEEITSKWKELMLVNHPDKDTNSETSTVFTQVLNGAKERALAQGATSGRPRDKEETARLFTEAERKRVLYGMLWMADMRDDVVKAERRHKRVWNCEKFKVLGVLIGEFVRDRVEPKVGEFTSCLALHRAFEVKHAAVDANFFYRKLRAAIASVPACAPTRRGGLMGYLGVGVRE